MNDNIRLLTIEKDRLTEMIQELEDVSGFRFGLETCPVCAFGRDWDSKEDEEKCLMCIGIGIKERCDYIDNYVTQWEIHDEYTNEKKYSEAVKFYLTDLFFNYIKQIEEKIEELSNEETST